jgi:secreted PhoX family phosphatase
VKGMDRRTFLFSGAVAAAASAARAPVALAQDAAAGEEPWDKYQIAGQVLDDNGVVAPEGFAVRVIAISTDNVEGTDYEWPIFPDGGACFSTDDGGWIYVVNSEVPENQGGVSAIRFSPEGEVLDAYAILTGTSMNCAGGATPWGTWLSCEEFDALAEGGEAGMVWECRPEEPGQGVARPAMGVFQHEAAAVVDDRQEIYLTEDQPDGCFYRFTPDSYPDLSAGRLDVAVVDDDGNVTWEQIPDPSGQTGIVRAQVPDATGFLGGEGIVAAHDMVFFTTKLDNRVWRYDPEAEEMEVIYDLEVDQGRLAGVDNITVTPAGDLLVAEDGGRMRLVLVNQDGETQPIVRVTGQPDSELAGPAFNPAGDRLYFNSQRGGPYGVGITFEMSGPFNEGTAIADDTGHTIGVGEEEAVLPATETTDDDGGTRWLLPALGGAGAVLLGAVAVWQLRNRNVDPEAGAAGATEDSGDASTPGDGSTENRADGSATGEAPES